MSATHTNGTVASAETHLAWLRARHAELKTDRHLDLEVPGYEGRLTIRCGPIPWPVMAKVQRYMTQEDADGRGLLVAQQDVIIAACREVLFDGDPIDPSGETRRIDPRLAELFGADTKTARDTLLWLFPHEINIASVAGELAAWTQDANAEADSKFVGE